MQKYNILDLNEKQLTDLQDIAENLGVKKVKSLKKQDLIYKILDEQAVSLAGLQMEKEKEKETRKEQQKKRGRKPNKPAENTAEKKQDGTTPPPVAGNKPGQPGRRPGRPPKNAPKQTQNVQQQAPKPETKPAEEVTANQEIKQPQPEQPVAATPAPIVDKQPVSEEKTANEVIPQHPHIIPSHPHILPPVGTVGTVVTVVTEPEKTIENKTDETIVAEAPSKVQPETKRVIFKHANDINSVLDQV
ncbi:MAG: Rho termination factor N-terminal domain-containing protein, partial [Tannerella sp.]|nr:Rho termination factor N-terminal domain-containing protein [Tannerella sp.]